MSRVPEDRGEAGREGRTQIGKAVVLIVVAAVIAVLVLHRNPSSTATSTSAGSSTSTSSSVSRSSRTTLAPVVAPDRIKVQVLNGLQSGSLATNLSGTLRASGYQTLAPLNTTAATQTSAIYVVTHHFYREAEALARTLGVPASVIHRGVPSSAPIPSGVGGRANLIVVIGTSLQAKAGS